MLRDAVHRLRDRLCPPSRRTSYALDRLDVKLASHLHRRNGFFIEAGGNDGVGQSNTLYLEQYLGWRGLLIEAIPALADECRKNRPRCAVENCALVSQGYADQTIEMHYCNLMSMVKRSPQHAKAEVRHLQDGEQFLRTGETPYTVTVLAKTLSRVLDERHIERVDLLSLDVEGYEMEVLRGIDFERHRPDRLLVEVRNRPDVERIIRPWYRQVDVLCQNDEYADILYEVSP